MLLKHAKVYLHVLFNLPKISEARLNSRKASRFLVEGAPKKVPGLGEGTGWPTGPAADLGPYGEQLKSSLTLVGCWRVEGVKDTSGYSKSMFELSLVFVGLCFHFPVSGTATSRFSKCV